VLSNVGCSGRDEYLQAIIEAKTGFEVGSDQDLTLLTLAPLREAATAAEDLALSDGLGL